MNQLEALDIQIKDHIALVYLDNPPVNAVNTSMLNSLALAMDQFSDDGNVRSVVLTGKGKVFCAGADLKNRSEITANPGGLHQHSRRTREAFHAIRECSKPVISAINGAALGAGLGIVASSDILVAGHSAKLGLPEVDVGLLGGVRHAQRLFGHSRLRRMMLTGMRVSGDELYRLGIVEACVPDEALLETAMDIARVIAEKSPLSIQLLIQTANAIEDMSLRDGYRYEQDMTAAIAKTEDAHEARAAFLEKRKAVFKGR
ncbi:MAG: enoyl-CoA hydratase/isomerase family protein [Advenella sp.]|uniref:enoyl-CoA hydratase/isomerase family protein n=1 Tax=Advenella sp. TaxID=1872388 RepID=UPI003F94408F